MIVKKRTNKFAEFARFVSIIARNAFSTRPFERR
jgi:hypothetical protein